MSEKKDEKKPEEKKAPAKVETETKTFKATRPGFNGVKTVQRGETFEMKVVKGAKPPSWADEVASGTPSTVESNSTPGTKPK